MGFLSDHNELNFFTLKLSPDRLRLQRLPRRAAREVQEAQQDARLTPRPIEHDQHHRVEKISRKDLMRRERVEGAVAGRGGR